MTKEEVWKAYSAYFEFETLDFGYVTLKSEYKNDFDEFYAHLKEAKAFDNGRL